MISPDGNGGSGVEKFFLFRENLTKTLGLSSTSVVTPLPRQENRHKIADLHVGPLSTGFIRV